MTTTEPNWLQLHRRAEAGAKQARVEYQAAREMRCKSERSGEQCTADQFPEHQHNYPVDEAEF